MRKLFSKLTLIAMSAVLIGGFLPTGNAGAISMPSNGGTYCGSGSWVLVGSLETNLTYRSGTTFCSFSLSPQPGIAAQLSAGIYTNSVSVVDQGQYKYYAGPVKMSLSVGRCATVVYNVMYVFEGNVLHVGRYIVCNA